MKNHPRILSTILYLSFACLFFVCTCQLLPIVDENGNIANSRLQKYIVHVQHPSGSANHLSSEKREQWHRSFLPHASLETGKPRMIYSYEHAISGFAAYLTPQEVKAMESMEGFLHAQPVETRPLQTTYTPTFLDLDLQNGMLPNSDYGNGVIIGILDTGIHPSHPSFNDKDMPNPPSWWKGSCDFLDKKLCTKKIIAARVFNSAISNPTPFDDWTNHGSHVAGIASGRFVENVNVSGLAAGTAVGMAPLAHIAVYKVCTPGGYCTDDDIMAGVDQAIKDGVHIISVSLAWPELPFWKEPFHIAALAAVKKGISVIVGAGNSGPAPNTIMNVAPWMMTVGATTTDRWLAATVTIAGREFSGESGYYTGIESTVVGPLISPPDDDCNNLSDVDVKGKIVLCWENKFSKKGEIVKDAGALGVIIMKQEKQGYEEDEGDLDVLPSTHVSHSDAMAMINILSNSVGELRATIKNQGTRFGATAPSVWLSSSRGPSLQNGGILKPDVVAPGVDIVSATSWGFGFMSGTSMATPHVSGIAALIKKVHPNLSPAAMRSAIMTSATRLNRRGDPIQNQFNQDASLFEVGAGHIRPRHAQVSPFVYDMDADDYIPYLCGLGYTDAQVSIIARRSIRCAQVGSISAEQLNYPSISLELRDSKTIRRTVTVTSVHNRVELYRVRIHEPEGITVTVQPEYLLFSQAGQKMSFIVHFQARNKSGSIYREGQLVWESIDSDLSKNVRSPILIKMTN